MDSRPKHLPIRWFLPVTQLLICFVILWPARGRLVFGIEAVALSYARSPQNAEQQIMNLPALTTEQERELTRRAKREELYIRVPIVLDFPIAIVQVPYILVAPVKREWVPKGVFPETWRALTWPFAGCFFWWLVGRGIEAHRAARQGIVRPRLRWSETVFAATLVIIGIVSLIGIVTSTPDDRNDIQFVALVAGGLLWGALSGLVIAARFGQMRIAKRTGTEPSQSPSPA